MARVDLSIIIVNWNSKDYLGKCIASILAGITDLPYEIVVIDSGSHDGSGEMLRRNYPQVIFIQGENLGFAKANNAAFRASTGDHVVFLNPDTEVRGSALRVMLDHIRRTPASGAVGCRLLNADGSVQTSCIQSFPTILNQFVNADALRTLFPNSSLWGAASLFNNEDGPTVVDAVSGACLMTRRSVFEEAGLFSEHYFMYAEDVDLCHKAIQAGYRNYYVPGATVVHFGGASALQRPSDFSVVMMRASIWQFLRNTKGERYALGYRLSMLVASIGRIACLLIMLPVYVTRGRLESWTWSLGKWRAISIWSMGLKRGIARSR
jgi:N-acetylglucosaminyl-diphospho-decaprenol L-rhamnosyltransferase